MIAPPYLIPGDTIGIIAPGRKVSSDDIKIAVQKFESSGFNIALGKNIFSTSHSYLSGTDDERLSDLQSMLEDEAIHTIICARGGYGTTRFIDKVDFSAFLRKPKWIVGFSDVTALHLRLYKLGVESIHGIMPVLFSRADAGTSVESLLKILSGERTTIEAPANRYNREGNATGEVVGGNLSLIVDSLGTIDDVDTSGRILVLEEVDEYKYKVDRMLTQLKRAGKLTHLAGLIIGHMTDINDTELSFAASVEEIISDQVKDFKFPVAFGFPSGHEQPNLAWRHGATMTLEVKLDGAVLKSNS